MLDPFRGNTKPIHGPALGAFAVTPSDAADLATPIRAVTLGTPGVLRYVGPDGVTYTTGALPAGTFPAYIRRILATGTTAGDLTGWI